MESVVAAIIANVHGKSARYASVSYGKRKNGIDQLGERPLKDIEEEWWHDQS